MSRHINAILAMLVIPSAIVVTTPRSVHAGFGSPKAPVATPRSSSDSRDADSLEQRIAALGEIGRFFNQAYSANFIGIFDPKHFNQNGKAIDDLGGLKKGSSIRNWTSQTSWRSLLVFSVTPEPGGVDAMVNYLEEQGYTVTRKKNKIIGKSKVTFRGSDVNAIGGLNSQYQDMIKTLTHPELTVRYPDGQRKVFVAADISGSPYGAGWSAANDIVDISAGEYQKFASFGDKRHFSSKITIGTTTQYYFVPLYDEPSGKFAISMKANEESLRNIASKLQQSAPGNKQSDRYRYVSDKMKNVSPTIAQEMSKKAAQEAKAEKSMEEARVRYEEEKLIFESLPLCEQLRLTHNNAVNYYNRSTNLASILSAREAIYVKRSQANTAGCIWQIGLQ